MHATPSAVTRDARAAQRATSTTLLSTSSRINQSIVFQILPSTQGPIDVFIGPTRVGGMCERWEREPGRVQQRGAESMRFFLPPYALPFSPSVCDNFPATWRYAHPIGTRTIPIPIGEQSVARWADTLGTHFGRLRNARRMSCPVSVIFHFPPASHTDSHVLLIRH